MDRFVRAIHQRLVRKESMNDTREFPEMQKNVIRYVNSVSSTRYPEIYIVKELIQAYPAQVAVHKPLPQW